MSDPKFKVGQPVRYVASSLPWRIVEAKEVKLAHHNTVWLYTIINRAGDQYEHVESNLWPIRFDREDMRCILKQVA